MKTPTAHIADRFHVATPRRLPSSEFPWQGGVLGYSVRRYFVDEFMVRHVTTLPRGSRVLDVGGFRGKKRGRFDLSAYPLDTIVANIAPSACPDLLCDASAIPCDDASFDAVILAEVVEHLPDASAALAEAGRVLRAGGVLLATAPFMFRVHADPIDVARYAPDWWRANLEAAGFHDGIIEPQGALFSVMAELARGWAHRLEETGSFWPGARSAVLSWLERAREWAIAHENAGADKDTYFSSFTTGFGVRTSKASPQLQGDEA